MKTKLLIFGITGDLSTRKLLPALHHIVARGDCAPLEIIGISRREVDVSELIEGATKSLDLCQHTRVVTMDVAKASEYQRLKQEIDQQADEQIVVYLSVPPGAAADIVDFLGQADINDSRVKIMFEKPFGYDETSARDFVQRTARYYDEQQIYRIDHFMAKDVAQDVLQLRRDADSRHHVWSSDDVASVTVAAYETLGVEDRAHFYEQTGALRDVLQGHLMQLLSLVLLDPTGDFELEQLPERRLAALEKLAVADPDYAIRGQYQMYGQEVENEGSTIETYVRVKLSSTDERWQGVPLVLETGKRLDRKETTIHVRYHDGTEDVFTEGKRDASFPVADAYERVLIEAMKGNKYIFTTSPEIIRAWQVLGPIQRAWDMNQMPLLEYQQGAQPGTIRP